MHTSKHPLIMNDRYRLDSRIGSGGMAVVYKGYDLMLERIVAVKLLRQDFSPNKDFRNRFHQEAKAAANLTHPNIVTVHDYGLSLGFPFIVMEFIHGMDLKRYLAQHGRFSVEETLNIMIQACAGLGYAHRAGLVHCDIKPHNMLISADQRLKITDFGIARAMASIPKDEHTPFVWGSPVYYAPEQAVGFAPSPASDVYSLGIVMYEMLVGFPPFQGNSAAELAKQHCSVMPTPPSNFTEDIPEKLEIVLMKILSKEPAARYRTADQLGHLLIHIKKNLVENAAPYSTYVNQKKLYHAAAKEKSNQQNNIPTRKEQNTESMGEIDWITVLLSLLALITVGGLIPFWIWILNR